MIVPHAPERHDDAERRTIVRVSFLTLWYDPRRLDATFGGVMGKYTVQAKLAAVKEYCAGKAGLRDVAH
ncbi:hypothetical protein, partial [Pseudomonas amygdali]|uniref:hypothetical protein n=1 Tax=Pseudomonas amygdali TaxID=47877 RepID=UPI001FB5B68E